MNIKSPAFDELRRHPVVVAALELAWRESLPDDPLRRHEEGGWIYIELATGAISIERAVSGAQRSINLMHPSVRDGFMIVGLFHTHPNPTEEGWDPEPSDKDRAIDERLGVPDLVRSDQGVFQSGPDSRRGGLTGSAGFPD